MPNAKVLSEKQAIVAELTEKLQKATAGVIVDYKGITVEEDTALRKECREGDVDYAVVKNTLLRFAFNNTGLNELDDLLNGTTSLALCMMIPWLPPASWPIMPRSWTASSRSRAASWTASPSIWPPFSLWLPFPLCLSCRLRFWVPCWLPLPVWLSS